MDRMLYQAKFVFSKEMPKFVENFISKQFMNLREYGCRALNPHYEEWNAEFNSVPHKIDENDELKDWGGKEYLDFITKKERKVLAQVNKEHPLGLVELDVDEIGDMIGRCKFNRDITVTLNLIPVNY